VTCTWTGYVNEFDEPVSFSCPQNEYLGGISSYMIIIKKIVGSVFSVVHPLN